MTTTPEDFAKLIAEFSLEFDARTEERHARGLEKYGSFKWLGTDLIEELKQELLDTSNYARYHYIKLSLLQRYLADDPRLERVTEEGEIKIGVDNFFTGGQFGSELASDQGEVNPRG